MSDQIYYLKPPDSSTPSPKNHISSMQSPLKISEALHNGKIQPRVYFPKGSPNKPNGGVRWYKSVAAAKAAIAENHALATRFGQIAKEVTVNELVEARAAAEELKETGFSLLEAAKQVKLALSKTLVSKSVKEGLGAYHNSLWEKFRERKKDNPRCEPRHWRSVKYTLARLKSLENTTLLELTPDKLRPLFKKLSKSSCKSHLRNLHAGFEYCIDEGWMESNPVQSLKRMTPDRATQSRTIKTFTVAQVRNFMTALAHTDIRAVPYFAGCFFAGVRPEAAMKLNWSDIGDNGYLYVPHPANKSGHAYNVQVLPVLSRWLEWWEAQGNKRTGTLLPLSAASLKRVRKRVMDAAGIRQWVQDGTRKTFATAHRGTFKCKIQTSAALGHKGTTVLDEHYDSRLMTEAEAAEYWKILPPEIQATEAKEFI
jgi:integrase